MDVRLTSDTIRMAQGMAGSAESRGARPAALCPHQPFPGYYGEAENRQRFLNALFNRTAQYYRAIDRTTGFGSGLWYRGKSLRDHGLRSGMRVLDVACGPGLVTQCAGRIVGPSGSVVGLDPSVGMLREARRGRPAKWVQGVGERLPFADNTFEFVSMGYALRHVSDLRQAFGEYYRVLKPRGIALILEICRPHSGLMSRLARFYIRDVMGQAFATVTGNRDLRTLMRYWWDTTEFCVPSDTILNAMGEVGFTRLRVRTLFGGLIRDYSGVKETRELGAVPA